MTPTFAAVLALMATGLPVAFAIFIPVLFYFTSSDLPISIFIQRMVSSIESFPLLAVPFFVLAGTIMHHAGIARRILAMAGLLVGRLYGGMGQVTILSGTLLGAMSGSANADTAILARAVSPSMIAAGYSRGYAAVIAAVSGILAPIIPPSIGLILYGLLAEVSVGKLFLAGVLPGVLIAAALMVTNHLVAKRRNYAPAHVQVPTAAEVRKIIGEGLWALMLPVLILVGLRLGVFTPTELGAFVVMYCLFIGVVVYKELNWRSIPAVFRESILTTSIVVLILSAGGVLNFIMTWEQVPQTLAQTISAIASNPWIILLILNVLLLLLGMFMESASLLVILTPLLAPLTRELGIDPVHFGIIMVLNLTVGGITPPVGTLMYTACSVVPCTVSEFVRELWPMLLALIGVLMVLTFIPQITLLLPSLLMP